MSILKPLTVAAALAVAALSAQAQTATPRVDQREAKQEARIEKGVASGQLTARETHRLDKEQAAVQKAEANAKADGKVTRAERRRLARMQNHASHDIRRQKHDAQTAPKP